MRVPGFYKFVLVAVLSYAILKVPGVFFSTPIPESVAGMYVFFAAVAALLAITATDEGARGFLRPLEFITGGRSSKPARTALFAALAVIAGYVAYGMVSPTAEPPVTLRATHPPSPQRMRAYGKTFELSGLANPYRGLEKSDPAGFKTLVAEGGAVYFKNCFFCHGAKLDGRGHYAEAMDPAPLPFMGRDTIAQLQESYVFWRIVKGGAGLPPEAAPWASSMPAWEERLSEDDVWKVVLFLYDFTGNRPRPASGTR